MAERAREIRFPMGTGIAGHVATTGESLNIPNAYDDARFNQEVDRKSGYCTKSILAIPLRTPDGKVGHATRLVVHIAVTPITVPRITHLRSNHNRSTRQRNTHRRRSSA